MTSPQPPKQTETVVLKTSKWLLKVLSAKAPVLSAHEVEGRQSTSYYLASRPNPPNWRGSRSQWPADILEANLQPTDGPADALHWFALKYNT